MYLVLLVCIATILGTLVLTPLVKRLAVKTGTMDAPNERRVNINKMPTSGGVAIFLPYFAALFFLLPIPRARLVPIFLGALMVFLLGLVDDRKELSPKVKMIGILLAGLIAYYAGDIRLETMTLPGIGMITFGVWSLPLTLLWIAAFTNAINLIDGLDGLASGISMIALTTMGIIGFFFLTIEDVSVSVMIFVLVAAIAGFWPYNFHPASIFLGDAGALFLGYMIGIFSLQGLKNATIISLILPIVILGIPITDTLYAMIRRFLNKQALSRADKHHIHHRLMSLGLSHRQTVLAIYCLAGIFSIIALLYNFSTFWGGILLTMGLLLGIELFVEIIGLVGEERQPLIRVLREFGHKLNRTPHDK
ncbi:glycosyltransferase family 4 protein [Atopococcus tabaci]|uniref:glycosyltransferase family 4 protein n=1 Tax=Atopococcus tabaci TaxID=269774 RepID=UPI002409A4DE|nr:MraY family glycosyltransferase [Atopococcus tabaci]